MAETRKELIWVGRSRKELGGFPPEVPQEIHNEPEREKERQEEDRA